MRQSSPLPPADTTISVPSESSPLLNTQNENSDDIDSIHSYEEPTFKSSLVNIMKSSWINLLLIFIPIGCFSGSFGWGESVTFWLNFLAIIPLAHQLGYATEELSIRTNQSIGALLNATFGNAVELILSIVALKDGLVKVVQASLLGSILSNLLLVTGFSFFLGGLKFKEQKFNVTAAQTSSSLLSLAVMSLLLPAAFVSTLEDDKSSILALSHGTAVILLIIYFLYLFFSLKTHHYLYTGEPEEEEERATLTLYMAILLLLVSTLLVAVCSEYLVGSIEGLSEEMHLSKTFVGLIILPIVGNAAEHVTAVTVAMKDKMDLSIGVAVGSSMQIALLVTPLLVVVGWITGQPMTLFFETFETAVLFISVLITTYLINDGRSNWLEGAMLLAAYGIVALAFFFHP